MLTTEIMRRMWPRAPVATVDAIVQHHEEVFEAFEIDTPLRVAHFMAQISHECGRGTIVRENMNYSAQRLLEVFGVGKHSAGITPDQARAIEHRPQLIAERVYGLGNPKKAKELGNTRPGDGYRYRGNGMLQLTGGASHEHIGALTGYDLYNNPEWLEDPATSFRVAAAEFKALKCLPAADADDVTLVTRRVNGGRNGLAERTVLLRQWKTVLPEIETPVRLPRGAPDPEQKSLVSSKIMQGATGTAASIAAAAASKVAENANTHTSTISLSDVADKVQQASDAVTTISAVKDNAVAVVQVAKPFMGLMPGTWSLIAVVALGVAAVCVGWTIWERYKKMRDQGV